jgi:hypothetical protein
MRKKEVAAKAEEPREHLKLKSASTAVINRLHESDGTTDGMPLPSVEKEAMEQTEKLMKEIEQLGN